MDALVGIVPSTNAETAKLLAKYCDALIAAEDDLNAINRLPLANHPQSLAAIGQELSQTMGGSSGALLAIFFAAAGDAAAGERPLKDTLKSGLARLQEVGDARLGDRTMIDALTPALEALDIDMASAAGAARTGYPWFMA